MVQLVAWVPSVKNMLKAFLKTAVIDGERNTLAIFFTGLKKL